MHTYDFHISDVIETAKLVPLVTGGMLIAYGVTARSKTGVACALLGGGFVWAGVRKASPSTNPAQNVVEDEEPAAVEIKKSVTVNKPPEELYRFWRRFENLPDYIKHLIAESGIDTEEENRRISWRSTEGAHLDHTGSVEFLAGPRGTAVQVSLRYDPSAGIIGQAIARLFGKDPSGHVSEDLRKFKQLMETGEITSTEGQPAGR